MRNAGTKYGKYSNVVDFAKYIVDMSQATLINQPKYLIVDESNFEKINSLVKEQLNVPNEYAEKAQQKHPAKDIYNVPMLSFVNWEEIISKITCEQVVELESDWIKVQEKIK